MEGKYAANFPFFGQERRGAPVAAFVRFGPQAIREKSRVYYPDIVAVFERALAGRPDCYQGLKPGGTAVLNAASEAVIPAAVLGISRLGVVDANAIAMQEVGLPITNSCMLGALARATGIVGVRTLLTAMGDFLKGDVLARNGRALQRGFEECRVQDREGKERAPKSAKKIPVKSLSSGIPFQSRYPAAWADGSKPLTLPTGEWRSVAPFLDPKPCRQCGWCSVSCPLGCMKPGEDGYFHPDLNYCKGCGICARECPAHAIRLAAEEVSES
jgi:pyruvate ferredoxin oxidoreductase gamma subunit